MKIEDMNNDRLYRELECTKREIKNLLSIQKQIEKELSDRFDEGRLGNGGNKLEEE